MGKVVSLYKGISKSSLLVWLCPVILLCVYLCNQPFSNVLSTKTVSLSPLTPQQKNNIALAATSLNGKVIVPGQDFSFNKIVGPRLGNNGYLNAKSYLGKETPDTIGGGICLVSSLLYQAALESGLQIIERHPHTRTLKTIPAGLDATVWYGQADLRFRNQTKTPIRIETSSTPEELTIKIMGAEQSYRRISIQNS